MLRMREVSIKNGHLKCFYGVDGSFAMSLDCGEAKIIFSKKVNGRRSELGKRFTKLVEVEAPHAMEFGLYMNHLVIYVSLALD